MSKAEPSFPGPEKTIGKSLSTGGTVLRVSADPGSRDPFVAMTAHPNIASPATAATTVAAPAIFAQSGHAAHHGRPLGRQRAASSRLATPSFERISETWYLTASRVMPRR